MDSLKLESFPQQVKCPKGFSCQSQFFKNPAFQAIGVNGKLEAAKIRSRWLDFEREIKASTKQAKLSRMWKIRQLAFFKI